MAAAGAPPVFSCRRCREVLFSKSDLVEHEPNPAHSFSHHRLMKEQSLGEAPVVTCSSFFLAEPQGWMKSDDVEGKIVCPKCSARVGSLKWAGGQCSCEFCARARVGLCVCVLCVFKS
jgi:dual specificity phosphatase 12